MQSSVLNSEELATGATSRSHVAGRGKYLCCPVSSSARKALCDELGEGGMLDSESRHLSVVSVLALPILCVLCN